MRNKLLLIIVLFLLALPFLFLINLPVVSADIICESFREMNNASLNPVDINLFDFLPNCRSTALTCARIKTNEVANDLAMTVDFDCPAANNICNISIMAFDEGDFDEGFHIKKGDEVFASPDDVCGNFGPADVWCTVGAGEFTFVDNDTVEIWSGVTQGDRTEVANITFCYEDAPADTTPPELLNNDAWCTSCNPIQKISIPAFNILPWITDDPTPTINFTTNEPATCAVMGNSSGFANYNYTDMIANGGVICSTTGGADHICTVQESNAFTVGAKQGVFTGCKDISVNLNEKTNATFGVEMGIYTFGTACVSDCIKVTAGAGLYLESGCTIIR